MAKKEVITVKYELNYNNKFYSKYFASIRDEHFRVIEGNMYEIEVTGKIIGSAKLVRLELINFHEIPSFQMSIITGMNHADSIQHYYKKGLNVKDFDLKVKLLFFEMSCYVPKATS